MKTWQNLTTSVWVTILAIGLLTQSRLLGQCPSPVTIIAGAPSNGFVNGIGTAARFRGPDGMATDSYGNLYIADYTNHVIRKMTPAGVVTTFAGSGVAGYADGFASDAQFYAPSGLTIDKADNLYVTDVNNHCIRKISPSGVVTTIAGAGGFYTFGYVDGPALSARFNQLQHIAIDNWGNLYVSETTPSGTNPQHVVRKIGIDGLVSTLNSTQSLPGRPFGITLDNIGNVYVGLIDTNQVYKISPTGIISPFAGGLGISGIDDGVGQNARFSRLMGMMTDAFNNIYVLDVAKNLYPYFDPAPYPPILARLRKITPEGVVSTVISFNNYGFGSGIALDRMGNLYANMATYEIVQSNICTGIGFVAWSAQTPPKVAVTGTSYSYTFVANGNPAPTYSLASGVLPPGLMLNPVTGVLSGTPTTAGNYGPIIINAANGWGTVSSKPFFIGVYNPGCNVVTTFAGGSPGYNNGTGTAAKFERPLDLATDVQGNIYVADGSSIRKVTPSRVVTRLAGGSGVYGFLDGVGTSARFNDIQGGITVDAASNVYVADYANYAVRKVTPTGVVTTIAGGPALVGYEDGPIATAKFSYVGDVAVDAAGNIYVGDANYIRKISLSSGMVSTVNTIPLSAALGYPGSSFIPVNLIVHPNGNIYFTINSGYEALDSQVWQLTPSGSISSIVGSSGAGYQDGPISSAKFRKIIGLVLDANGNLYVSDYFDGTIRYINFTLGLVSTVAGSPDNSGQFLNGIAANAGFYYPWGVALDGSGNLFVGDQQNSAVRRISTCNTGAALYGYSGTIFPEAGANNGSITATQIVYIGNADTWANAIANGTNLTLGTHYTVANVPAGLTMVLTKTSSTQVQISFTGNATAHANANDVNNIRITFLNAAVQSGNVALVGGLNGVNLSIDFANPTVLTPTLTCTPITSTGGNVVVLNGTNFTGATSVRFGGVNASSFTVNSATQITATVAFGSTSGTYAVTTPGGTTSCPSFTYIPTPPIINSFNPAFGVSPQNVTISGTNFLGTTAVSFGGVPATIVSVTNTKIVVTLGVGTVSSTPITVAVSKPDGTATLTGFVYSSVPPIPNIGSFTPACGTTGTVVTINGTGFSGAKSVKFGNTPAAFTILSDSQILATVGNGATGDITVSSLSGTNILPGFTYNPLPTITGFTPNNPDAGQILTITGTNFTGLGCGATLQSLYLGGRLVPSGNITVSPTSLTVIVPANASSGTVQLIRTDNSSATRTGFLFNAPRPISFTPTSGTTGTAIIITGQNFSGTSGAAGVRINGVNAASYVVNSDTQITAFPAATSAVTGTIVVTNTNGNGSAGTFTFTPPPAIDGFYASYGTTGSTITLYGRFFTGAFQVKFGNVLGSITSVSATQLVATVGAGATGSVSITTPGGVGTRAGFRFATTATAAPTITAVSPQPVSQQDSVLSITGTNLNTTTGVLLNGTPLQIVSAAAGLLRVRIPVGSASGTLTVYTQGGTVVTSPVTVLPLPTITSFSPTTGPTGTSVTIIGSGFTGTTGAASVRFGATNAASYTVVNDNTITATVAGGATGTIRVVAPGGTVFSATNFTYVAPTPAPTITGISTDIGTTGTVVVINGANFVSGSTSVSFGGTPAAVTFISPTQIQATVGAGNSGNIVVTTPNGSANSNAALGVNFTYLPHPIPTITSFSPASGTEGSTVTIVGNYLAGTSRITIGGALVTSFVVNANGSITATVPSGATTGKIIIYKDVVSPTNTLIAQSATNYTVIPLLAFYKPGSEITSNNSNAAVTAGIPDVQSSGILLFPNPAQTNVTIQATLQTEGLVRLSIINALGATVWTTEVFVQSGAFERDIEVSKLPSGFYMTELRIGTERLIKRFVKR